MSQSIVIVETHDPDFFSLRQRVDGGTQIIGSDGFKGMPQILRIAADMQADVSTDMRNIRLTDIQSASGLLQLAAGGPRLAEIRVAQAFEKTRCGGFGNARFLGQFSG